jgi:excisionase family DNA binding protein
VIEARYLTVADAASYLSRTPAALYLLVHRGRIPYIKQGGRLFFDRLALDEWMEEGWHEATESSEARPGVVRPGPSPRARHLAIHG